MSESQDPLPQTIGRYTIRRRLGAGGMSTVYEAHDPLLDKRVALKQLRDEHAGDSHAVAMFLDEARKLGRLDDHKGILEVLDCDKDHGVPFLTMRYVGGGTLTEQLIGGKTLPASRLCSLAFAMGSALDYAHSMGVVHCDVKPGNILLSDVGDYVLSDFGISQLVQTVLVSGDAEPQPQPAVAYTALYASPEQVRHEVPTERSDIFSLALVFYRACCGRTPYGESVSRDQLQDRVLTERPAPPSRWNPEIPAAVDEVLLQGLEKDPHKRQTSAGRLAQQLIDALGDAEGLSSRSAGRLPADAGDSPAKPREHAAPEAERRGRGALFAAGLLAALTVAFFVWFALDGSWPPAWLESGSSVVASTSEGESAGVRVGDRDPPASDDLPAHGVSGDDPGGATAKASPRKLVPRVDLPSPPTEPELGVRVLLDTSGAEPEVLAEVESLVRRVSAAIGGRSEYGVLEVAHIEWPESASAEWISEEAARRGADLIVALRLEAKTVEVPIREILRHRLELDGLDLLVGGVDASSAPNRYALPSAAARPEDLHASRRDAAREALRPVETSMTEWVLGILDQRSENPKRPFVVTVYDEAADPGLALELRRTLAKITAGDVRLVSGLNPWRLIVQFEGPHHQMTASLVDALVDALPAVRFAGSASAGSFAVGSDTGSEDGGEPVGPPVPTASVEFGKNARQIVVRLQR